MHMRPQRGRTGPNQGVPKSGDGVVKHKCVRNAELCRRHKHHATSETHLEDNISERRTLSLASQSPLPPGIAAQKPEKLEALDRHPSTRKTLRSQSLKA